jgi:Chaperone of endosialidase
MAKTKISEFSTTANNNSDINSINISEGCAPSGINDAIRELMRQLKEFQTGGAGDSVNSGGDFSVATNKFTVASATGNTAVAGTLGATGDFAVNTNKFTVTAASGNTAVAGTLASTGNFAVNTDKFTVAASSGNTAVAGTFAVTGATTLTGALVANGNSTLGDADTDTVTLNASFVNGTTLKTAKTATNTLALAAYDVDGTAYTNLVTLTAGNTPSLALTSTAVGTINNMSIGATTASTGAFTTLSASSDVTLSGGTANGVLYLNGSKVATSGSALTFDGTNLGVNGRFVIDGTVASAPANGGMFRLTSNDYTYFSGKSTGGGTVLSNGDGTASIQLIRNAPASYIFFEAGNGSEGMRLTSTGLGIGTSSPAYKLDVTGQIRASVASGSAQIRLERTATTAGASWIGADADALLRVYTTGFSTQLMLDSSGNLGLGVTPSAWASGLKAFDIGSIGSVIAATSDFNMGFNVYYDGANKYKTTGYATNFQQTAGQFRWLQAASGTAGNAITFTQAMTLDSSGNLGVGYTSPRSVSNYRTLALGGTSNGGLLDMVNGSGSVLGTWYSDSTGSLTINADPNGSFSSSSIQFQVDGTERARIDSSGNLCVNTTAKVYEGKISVSFDGNGGSGSQGIALIDTNSSLSGDYALFVNSSGNVAGRITHNGTTTVAYTTSSDYRLKDEIQPMTGALAKVSALKPVTYKWKDDKSASEGFIAHELAEVCPQAVVGEKDAVDSQGNPVYQGIDTSFLVATLTAAIQELKAEFDAYKATHP